MGGLRTGPLFAVELSRAAEQIDGKRLNQTRRPSTGGRVALSFPPGKCRLWVQLPGGQGPGPGSLVELSRDRPLPLSTLDEVSRT